MTPVHAIRTGLAKSFTFSGRASRAEFWWFASAWIASAATLLSQESLFLLLPRQLGVLGSILLVLTIFTVPLTAVFSRRLRDAGLVGSIAFFLPVYLITAPLIAHWIDASERFGVRSINGGMPELAYAGMGYLILVGILLLLSLLPSRHNPPLKREHEVTP